MRVPSILEGQQSVRWRALVAALALYTDRLTLPRAIGWIGLPGPLVCPRQYMLAVGTGGRPGCHWHR